MKVIYLLSLTLLVVAVLAQKKYNGVISSPPLITSDVLVPAGTTCALDGVDVTGSVRVSPNAAVTTTGNVRLLGSATGTDCDSMLATRR